MWIRFILYGLGGIAFEVIYTSLVDNLPRRNWQLMGRSYLWMFFVYGLLALLFEPVHNLIREYPWWVRAIIWSLGFTTIELLVGWTLKRLTGQCPWDYVARGKRFAINSYIRWDFFVVWAIIGLVLEWVHDFLVEITPAIEAAIGLT